MEGDLNVSIFGNELNALVKAPKDASGNTLESFVNWVLFVSNLLILINDILEDDSDQLNKSDQERSESYRSAMVPGGPSEGFANANFVR